jgi:hypothetical protein
VSGGYKNNDRAAKKKGKINRKYCFNIEQEMHKRLCKIKMGLSAFSCK